MSTSFFPTTPIELVLAIVKMGAPEVAELVGRYFDAEAEKRRANQRERTQRCRDRARAVTLQPDRPSSLKEEENEKRGDVGFPEDWEPNEPDLEAARQAGLPDDQVPAAVAEFRSHWLARSAVDVRSWTIMWAGWCRRRVALIAQGRVPGARQGRGPKPPSRPVPSKFVVQGSPEWLAIEAATGKKLIVTRYEHGEPGIMVRRSAR